MNSRETTLLEALPTGLYIDGKWVDGADGTFDVHDPATGDVIARVAEASAQDGLRGLDAAVDAQRSWARTPPRNAVRCCAAPGSSSRTGRRTSPC